MSKHTPGPWRISVGGTISNQIEAFCGKKLDDLDDGYRAVASFHPCEPTGLFAYEKANAEANASLIASAPELLEALEYMLNSCPAIDTNGEEAHQKARAAIAKARGEA